MARIKRALLSVSDKAGLVDFARVLVRMGVEILSTGGTKATLDKAGIPCTAVEDYTGFPEMMDGRVKTLHPKVHGALLGVRDNPKHVGAADTHGIKFIDLLVANLYPFRETIAKPDVSFETAVENIDIGGPAMLRSAAKNHKYVAVVCNPARYKPVIAEMKRNRGAVSDKMRRELALEAFAHTGQYDAAIAMYLSKQFAAEESQLPQYFAPWYVKIDADLRYGENPHQRAAAYKLLGAAEDGLAGAVKLHGDKELSFNNYLDLAAALETVRDFTAPTAVIIKHLNPCGLASAGTLAEAFTDAWVGDPISAFGSVMGFNRVVDVVTARRIGNTDYLKEAVIPRYRRESGDEDSEIIGAFVEAIIAPGYTPAALRILKQKKNLRIMLLCNFWTTGRGMDLETKAISGGAVIQTQDTDLTYRGKGELKVVTKVKPTADQIRSMLFAEVAAKHVKSNAIVLVQGTRLVGCGAGQMSRVDSCRLAAAKAGQRAIGAVLGSDAMFPATDGLEAAAETGCAAIIQPGGSIRDKQVIAAANKREVAMVFTGMRHFWH